MLLIEQEKYDIREHIRQQEERYLFHLSVKYDVILYEELTYKMTFDDVNVNLNLNKIVVAVVVALTE